MNTDTHHTQWVTWVVIICVLTLGAGAYWFVTKEFTGRAAETVNVAHTEALTGSSLGLVGYWTLDGSDIKWSDSTTEIKDTSGNSKHGDAQGSLAAGSATPGQVGQGLRFNGTSDVISLGTVYNGVKTIAFWAKPNSTTQSFIDLNGTATIDVTSGTVAANNFTSPTIYVDGAVQGSPAPTLIGTSGSTWNDTSSTETTGSLSWQTGDLIVVTGMTEDQLISLSTPTATGLTFAAVSGFPTNLANTCKGYAWTATAGSNGSGTISSGTGGSYMAGIQAYVFRGSDGIGNTAQTTSGTALTISLTRNYANSMVVWAAGDWGATNDTTVSSDPVGGNQRQAAWRSGVATLFDFDWGDQGSAGSTSYGISGFSPGNVFTKIALEVRGSSNIISDTNWHHVVVTTDTGINASAVNLGKISSSYFGGTLDDIRFYSSELSSTQVTDLYRARNAREVDNAAHREVLTNGLVGYWTFDGRDIKWSDTSSEIKDISGNSNHGDATGSLATTSVIPGTLGQALSFNGSSDYMTMSDPGNTISCTTEKFSVSLWIYMRGSGGQIWGAGDPAYSGGAYILAYPNGITGGCDNTSDSRHALVSSPSGAISANQWYHVILTFDGSTSPDTASLYINGVLSATDATGSDVAETDGLAIIRIGDDLCTACGTSNWNGNIDDVRVYNRILSSAEITNLYNLGR